MKSKLTGPTVKALEVTGKVYNVRDTEQPGLILKVTAKGAKTFFIDYRNADGRRQSYRLGSAAELTPTEARRLARKKLGEALSGKDPQAVKKAQAREARTAKLTTLRGFLDLEYAPFLVQERRTAGKLLNILYGRFPDWLDKPMARITEWNVTRWKSDRKKAGVQPATINKDLGTLKAALNKAVAWGIIDENPLARVRPAKVDDGRVRFLSADEEQRLREALAARDARKRARRHSGNAWREARGYEAKDSFGGAFADYLQPLVLLAMNTGLRRGELFSLRWTDVDIDRAILTVEGAGAKSGKTRHIPLNREALDVLTEWKAQSGDDLVFVSPSTGEKLDNINRSWRALRAAADLEDFNFHDLRHHFASRLVMASVDLNTVRELLGHADLKMTLRYSHLAPEHKAAAVAALDQPRAG